MKKKKKRKGRSKTPQLHKPRCQPYLLCDGIWGISQWPEHDSNMPGAKSRGRHLTLHNNSGMQAITNADLIYASLSYIQSYLLEMCSLHSTYPQGAVRSHHETGARTPVLSQPHTTALAQQGWKQDVRVVRRQFWGATMWNGRTNQLPQTKYTQHQSGLGLCLFFTLPQCDEACLLGFTVHTAVHHQAIMSWIQFWRTLGWYVFVFYVVIDLHALHFRTDDSGLMSCCLLPL